MYAGQETTVRTGHEIKDWFQIRKGVYQSCILSPWLFNLYADYIIKKFWIGCTTIWNQDFGGEISVTSDTQITPHLG